MMSSKYQPRSRSLLRRIIAHPAGMWVLLAAVCVLIGSVPSSGRAGDFVKIGSPIGTPVNIYGLTSLYDGNPANYEAWAVGETANANGVGTGQGVILHYTGSYWTKISVDEGTIPVLRAVSAVRYIRTQNDDGTGSVATWTTAAWAVGDGGTIYHLNPYTNAWRVEKQLYLTNGTPTGRACLDTELTQNNGNDCRNWTTQNLYSVAAVASTTAFLGGNNGTFMTYYEYFAPDSTGTTNYRNISWQDAGAGLGTVTVVAINYINSEHAWIATYKASDATSRIYSWDLKSGYQFATSITGERVSGLTAVLRSTATTPNQPLTSVVWASTESGKILRYDQATGTLTTQYAGTQPIHSITVARRSAGQNQNQLKNGNFLADRQDGGNVGFMPDGWKVNGVYQNVRNLSIQMVPSALIPENPANPSGGNIYVGSPWQAATTWAGLQASVRYVGHYSAPGGYDFVSSTYPNIANSGFEAGSNGFPTYSLVLPEVDVSPALLKTVASDQGAILMSGQQSTGAQQLGNLIQGFIKINQLNQPYQFRVVSPNGKAQLYIEQDLDPTKATICFGGVKAGQACTYSNGDADCLDPVGTNNGVCRGTQYPSVLNTSASLSSLNPPLTPMLTPGECSNEPSRTCSSGPNAGQSCSTDNSYKCNGGTRSNLSCTVGKCSGGGDCVNKKCVGGTTPGAVCLATQVCPGEVSPGVPAACVYTTTNPGPWSATAQCPAATAGSCTIGKCHAQTSTLCYSDSECQTESNPSDYCDYPSCTSDANCTNGTADNFDSCVLPLPICSSSQQVKCFNDIECSLGSCEVDTPATSYSGPLSRCYADAACGVRSDTGANYKCQPWGICAGGSTPGKTCIQYGSNNPRITRDPNADCGGGTCVVQTVGICKNAPTGAAMTPNSNSDANDATTPAVSFSGLGIKSRECTSGSAAGHACYDDSQCPGGGSGSCQIVGTGWYPFVLQYYQVNAATCVGGSRESGSCVSNADCVGGSCVNGTWCIGGTHSGDVCNFNSTGQTVAGDRTNACTSNGGSCVTQYAYTLTNSTLNPTNAPGVCVLNNQQACWLDSDCKKTGSYDYGRCSLQAKYTDAAHGAGLKLQWKTPGSSTWTDVPASNIMSSFKPTNNISITQEVPLSNIPGNTYKITGSYKADFPNYLPVCPSSNGQPCYQSTDPRVRANPRAGVTLSCKNTAGSANTCGFDVNTMISDPSHGVTGQGYCSDNQTIACTTNSQCGANGFCQGGWQPFTMTVSKQNRDGTGIKIADDPSQTLVVGCFADVGAEIFCKDITVTQVSNAAVPDLDTVDVVAVGDNGTIIKATDDFTKPLCSGNSCESWVAQRSPSGAARLNAVVSPDPYHYWIGGTKLAASNDLITLLTLNPGNVSGWAWVGASSSNGSTDPTGWIDFNCGNLGSCQSQPSAFGVNVGDPAASGVCSNNLTKSCSTATQGTDCGAGGTCLGAVSGSAWLGNKDASEQMDFGSCQNALAATGSKRCSDNNAATCTTDADCKALNAGTCKVTEVVKCTAWDQTTLTYCSSNSARLCTAGSTSQCLGYCSKNQGFRCMNDSDCVVSCAQNPAACRSAGWLSFDRTVTGNPPDQPYQNTGTSTPLATYDATNGQLQGWARLQLGVCTNDESKSCFKDADCGGNTCSYKNAASWASCRTNNSEASCNASVGWVKFRTNSAGTAAPAAGSSYYQCTGCTGTSCQICSNASDPAHPTCNSCTSCVPRRCTEGTHRACSTNNDCAAANEGECRDYGYCSAADAAAKSTNYCFSNSDCGASGTCSFGGTCTAAGATCSSCSAYGVSLDNADTKNFSGYAYSPDLGWIDFGQVRVGAKQYLQTQFGDIYSGGDIGGPSTSKAPGYPGGIGFETNMCNATYRIVAAGTIANFCTSAPVTGTTNDPFRQENASLYPLPSSESSYASTIGTLDTDGLTLIAKTSNGIKYNKYGDRVVEVSDPTDPNHLFMLSDVLSATNCGKPCGVHLAGVVYHVKGNLKVEKDYLFLAGWQDASGTIIVDGTIDFAGNLDYEISNTISLTKQLPSVAFIAGSDMTIECFVGSLKGAFYTPGAIHAPSCQPDAQQLTVSGAMVAQSFDLQRQYNGSVGTPEPAIQIVYDGRIQTNTPPGLATLASGIMSIQAAGQ